MEKTFWKTLPFLCLFLGGCMTADEKLISTLDKEAFWNGRNTPRQFVTDRIISPETAQNMHLLLTGNEEQKAKARLFLTRLRDLIDFGTRWDMPAFELNPGVMLKPPVIDGKIDNEEWKRNIEISGTCRAGRRRRNFDGSRMLLKYDKNNLYLAAYFPFSTEKKNNSGVDKEEHVLFYFDTPGEAGTRYTECVFSPARGGVTAILDWNYCNNGKRIQLPAAPGTAEIQSASQTTQYGYTVEMAIPRSLLRIHPNGCCRINLLRWDVALQDYRTPIAIPFHGHDPFNRINLRLD